MPTRAPAKRSMTGPEAKAAGLLKISEVARRADVAASTVKYYLSQGLLPEPVKTSRNMAYYPPETVEWVTLVKRLQRDSFLPLDAVKKVLAKVDDPADVERYFSSRASPAEVVGSDLAPVPEAELVGGGAITAADLEKLVATGIVKATRRGGRATYSAEDAAIVRQLVRIRESGLTPERGFGVEHLALYREVLDHLVDRELEVAMKTVVGSVDPDEITRVARHWVDGTNELISLLHRKMIRERLEAIELGPTAPPARSTPSRKPRRRP